MGSEIAIAVVFLGVILLAICAAAFKSMAKIFVGVIGALGAYQIIMTWTPSDIRSGVDCSVDSLVGGYSGQTGQKREGAEESDVSVA